MNGYALLKITPKPPDYVFHLERLSGISQDLYDLELGKGTHFGLSGKQVYRDPADERVRL